MNFPDVDVFHKLKCRMCFGDFDSTNNAVQISSEIAGMFFEVTHKTVRINFILFSLSRLGPLS